MAHPCWGASVDHASAAAGADKVLRSRWHRIAWRARAGQRRESKTNARALPGWWVGRPSPAISFGCPEGFFPLSPLSRGWSWTGGPLLNQMGSSLLSGALGFGAAQIAYWANNCLQRFEDGLSSYCRQQPNPYLTAIWCVFVCPLDRESSH